MRKAWRDDLRRVEPLHIGVAHPVKRETRHTGIKVLNIAHRGASACKPENTLEAFTEAFTLGADMIEMDVRRSVDGHLVLLHDETVDRTTNGSGPVSEFTLAQVKALDAGLGSRIPSLEEVFSHFVQSDVLLNLEIKCPGIETEVVQLVHRRFSRDRVLISSFQPAILRGIREIDREMRIGLLVGKTRSLNPVTWVRDTFPLSTFRRLAADTLHPDVHLALPGFIGRCKREGIPLYVWVVDGEPEMRRLIRQGVDGIFTNRPDTLRSVIRQEIGGIPEGKEGLKER
jgi:glycerophosphoryl diester phosphodiesterase